MKLPFKNPFKGKSIYDLEDLCLTIILFCLAVLFVAITILFFAGLFIRLFA